MLLANDYKSRSLTYLTLVNVGNSRQIVTVFPDMKQMYYMEKILVNSISRNL